MVFLKESNDSEIEQTSKSLSHSNGGKKAIRKVNDSLQGEEHSKITLHFAAKSTMYSAIKT